MNELFPSDVGAMLSPRLVWRKKHGVQTAHSADCGDEDFLPWFCWLDSDCARPGEMPGFRAPCGYGRTEDEAMRDLAVTRGIPLWNESQN